MGIGLSRSEMTPGQIYQWYGQQPAQTQFNFKQKSPINDLLAQAMAAQPAAPTLAQLFPSMQSTPMTNYSGLLGNPMGNQMQGQYGAGRFLGGNAMANYGSTSNAMNTM